MPPELSTFEWNDGEIDLDEAMALTREARITNKWSSVEILGHPSVPPQKWYYGNLDQAPPYRVVIGGADRKVMAVWHDV